MTELRITDTNSANDSRGRAFGLEGNDFIYVLVAIVAALGIYAVCAMVLHISTVGALVLPLPVLFVPVAWVVLLRHNKPAGYAEDWFDHWVNREGWSLAPAMQRRRNDRNHYEQPRA